MSKFKYNIQSKNYFYIYNEDASNVKLHIL